MISVSKIMSVIRKFISGYIYLQGSVVSRLGDSDFSGRRSADPALNRQRLEFRMIGSYPQ
jgi:hypothetical protein